MSNFEDEPGLASLGRVHRLFPNASVLTDRFAQTLACNEAEKSNLLHI